MIGGAPVVTLQRPRLAAQDKPQFLQVQVLPGRGMNILQIRAWLPGLGEINLLSSPELSKVRRVLTGDGADRYGNKSFSLGGAILVPYPNRIRGKLLPGGDELETLIAGKEVRLPANWKGKNPGAEKHAMHGLILAAKMDNVQQEHTANECSVTGTLLAGDFGGQWISSTDLRIRVTLKDNSVELEVVATNVGDEKLPIGIGWHPYFAFPSHNRKQVRLHIPARQRALVNNYDDVFPTGKVESVRGTAYDFTAPEGRALGDLYLDDNFFDLIRRPDGSVVAKVMDPEARYELRIIGESPHIRAFQVYAPPPKSFVALEPQFNLADPFNSKIWDGRDTGMVLLNPGESVKYTVRLELGMVE